MRAKKRKSEKIDRSDKNSGRKGKKDRESNFRLRTPAAPGPQNVKSYLASADAGGPGRRRVFAQVLTFCGGQAD